MITACELSHNRVQIRRAVLLLQKLTGRIWEGPKEGGDDQPPESFAPESILAESCAYHQEGALVLVAQSYPTH